MQGNGFTVTYGKIGTAEQTQTKTFKDNATAQAEADKLIKEKTKKGYVETTPKASTAPKVKRLSPRCRRIRTTSPAGALTPTFSRRRVIRRASSCKRKLHSKTRNARRPNATPSRRKQPCSRHFEKMGRRLRPTWIETPTDTEGRGQINHTRRERSTSSNAVC